MIVALVFLLIMTLIGVTGMQGSTQQERMAGNMRDRNLAFQAAEAALRAGERSLDKGKPIATGGVLIRLCSTFNPPLGTAFNIQGANGLLTAISSVNNNLTYWSGYTWDNTKSIQVPANTLGNLAQQPRYVIEDISAIDTVCSTATPPANDCYRITARGVGGTTDAVVILQSTYKARTIDCRT